MKSTRFQDQHIHFVGISGIGMSAIARILAERGTRVSGSDRSFSPIFDFVRERGGACTVGHAPENVCGADLVIYSPAVPRHNCELAMARSLNLPVLSRAQMLNALADEHRGSIAVTGTHGKSTTSWLVAKMLIDAGTDPTVLIGALANELGSNARCGNSEYFVAEVCESDGVFSRMKAGLGIVTNIDLDHLDFYRNLDHISAHFLRFMSHARELIVCADDARCVQVADESGRPYFSYGIEKGDLRATPVDFFPRGCEFEVECRGEDLGLFQIPLLGRHNILNSLAAIGAGLQLGIPLEVMKHSLASNHGVDRRLSLRRKVGGVYIWDDYGHHPAEVASTLAAIRPAVKGRLFVVFQPHRYTRTQALHREFGAAFREADHLIVTEIYSAGEEKVEGVSGRQVAQAAKKFGAGEAQFMADQQLVPPRIAQSLEAGDAVLLLGAGDIYKLADPIAGQIEIVSKLAERNAG